MDYKGKRGSNFDLTEEPIVAFNRNAERAYTVDPVSGSGVVSAESTGSNQPIT